MRTAARPRPEGERGCSIDCNHTARTSASHRGSNRSALRSGMRSTTRLPTCRSGHARCSRASTSARRTSTSSSGANSRGAHPASTRRVVEVPAGQADRQRPPRTSRCPSRGSTVRSCVEALGKWGGCVASGGPTGWRVAGSRRVGTEGFVLNLFEADPAAAREFYGGLVAKSADIIVPKTANTTIAVTSDGRPSAVVPDPV